MGGAKNCVIYNLNNTMNYGVNLKLVYIYPFILQYEIIITDNIIS